MAIGPDIELNSYESPDRHLSALEPEWTWQNEAHSALDFIFARVHMLECRSWNEFYQTNRINQPKKVFLQSRVAANLVYYQVNYCIIAIASILIVCLIKPWFLLVLVCALLLGFYLFLMRPQIRLILFGKAMDYRFQLRVFTSIFVLLLIYTGDMCLWLTAMFCATLIVGHASFHIPHIAKQVKNISSAFQNRNSMKEVLFGKHEQVFDEENPVREERLTTSLPYQNLSHQCCQKNTSIKHRSTAVSDDSSNSLTRTVEAGADNPAHTQPSLTTNSQYPKAQSVNDVQHNDTRHPIIQLIESRQQHHL